MKTFLISDTHFGHNALCHGLRNMTSNDSDNLIIDNWNKVVSNDDEVIICGDFTYENYKEIGYYLNKLNGKKIVILGNHETKECVKEFMFYDIDVVSSLYIDGYIITHIPIHIDEVKKYYKGNIHGHIHKPGYIDGFGQYDGIELDSKYYFNVNCEFNNYTPIEFDVIKKHFEMENVDEDKITHKFLNENGFELRFGSYDGSFDNECVYVKNFKDGYSIRCYQDIDSNKVYRICICIDDRPCERSNPTRSELLKLINTIENYWTL